MGGELTIRAPLRLPELPPEVRHAVAQFLEPCRHLPQVLMLPKERRAWIAALLARADEVAGPAPRAVVFDWMLEINGAVRKELDEAEFGRRVDAVCEACAEIPGWAWNRSTLRAGLRAWTWFPAAADVVALLEAEIGATTRTLHALRAIAAARPEPEQAPSRRSDEERAEDAAAVAGLMAMVRREMGEREPPRRGPGPKYLTGEALEAMRAASPVVQRARRARDAAAA